MLLSSDDKIRLHNFPPAISEVVAEIVRQVWPSGIQARAVVAGGDEFKLKGSPCEL
jgi:hypothetical protein